MSHALVVGKFYPPHAGHHYLINKAIRECEKVTVAACYSSVENIAIEDRQAWLYDAHGERSETFEVITVKDDTPVAYTDETWGFFLDALMESLDWQGELGYPDTIYSGESYAPEFAERLDRRYDDRIARDLSDSFPDKGTVRAIVVDRNEIGFQISATAVRSKPQAYWDYLAPATRAGLAKRVVICGAESTGTTTLAKALAQHYRTTVVPEYGRHFDWAVGKHHKWTHADFIHIAEEQKRWEDKLARVSENGLLICDTDEFATAMFSEVYLGEQTPEIIDIAKLSAADLYIVTSDLGVPFEDDGTRHDSGRRPWMTQWFATNLPSNTAEVFGDHETRLKVAIQLIDKMLQQGWHIEDPIEYR